VNNAAKHSGCTRLDATLELADARLRLVVKDDGRGFDPGARGDGHGLGTMTRRAGELGGRLQIDSRAGQGTTVEADLPLRRPSR
jgi:signal transduction histidine kinase